MKKFEILIVTRSIVLLQGLGALLESLPVISKVKTVRDLTSAYAWIEAYQPKIILLDLEVLGNKPEAVLEKIQAVSPKTRRVLLVDDVQKRNLVPGYAEAILIKGAAPSAVAAIVTNLLVEKGDENEHNDPF